MFVMPTITDNGKQSSFVLNVASVLEEVAHKATFKADLSIVDKEDIANDLSVDHPYLRGFHTGPGKNP